jgi:type II secretory pathway pseudopilin PulG
VEVIVAGSIMVILCVGILSVFSYAVKVNRGEKFRMQSLSVLQQEVEYYRSLKFVPNGSPAELNGGTYANIRRRCSDPILDPTVNPAVADCPRRDFFISVKIDNDPYTAGVQTGNDATCTFKEITITALPVEAETGWTTNSNTVSIVKPETVVIQRVKYN